MTTFRYTRPDLPTAGRLTPSADGSSNKDRSFMLHFVSFFNAFYSRRKEVEEGLCAFEWQRLLGYWPTGREELICYMIGSDFIH